MFRDRHRRTQENAQLLTLAIWHIKSTSSSTIAYGQNCMTAEPGIVAVVPVAVRVSPGATYLLCAISRKRHVSMRRLWALHIFSLLSCCGLRTSSNKTSYAYRTVVRNSWRVRLEDKTDRRGVLYDIAYNCQVVQWACLERPDVGCFDPPADNVPDRLVQSKAHSRPVEVRSTHIIGDEECGLDMIGIDGSMIDILTQMVRTL